MMNYKGYQGHVVYDDEAKIFHGEVINTRTVITFQGQTVDEIEQAFVVPRAFFMTVSCCI